jgi:hypothetical protein
MLRCLILAVVIVSISFEARGDGGADGGLYLNGRVDQQMYERISAFQGDAITVNSLGGSVVWGTRIAEVLAERDIKVTVDGVCISACFSYIFLPAAQRILKRNAKIGMHIGPDDLALVADAQGKVLPQWDAILARRIRAVYARRNVSDDLSREAIRRFNIRLIDLPLMCRTLGDPQLGIGRLPCQRRDADVRTWYLSTEQLRRSGITFEGAEIHYRWIGDVPLDIILSPDPEPAFFGDCLLDLRGAIPWKCEG